MDNNETVTIGGRIMTMWSVEYVKDKTGILFSEELLMEYCEKYDFPKHLCAEGKYIYPSGVYMLIASEEEADKLAAFKEEQDRLHNGT
jgi:hypothetical protein